MTSPSINYNESKWKLKVKIVTHQVLNNNILPFFPPTTRAGLNSIRISINFRGTCLQVSEPKEMYYTGASYNKCISAKFRGFNFQVLEIKGDLE